MIAPEQHTVVYGPVKTTRFGKALVVDPVPCPPDEAATAPAVDGRDRPADDSSKPHPISVVCTGGRIPSGGVVVTSAARRLIELSKGGEKLETILVTGVADPTLHPGLREIAENLRDLRDKWYAKAGLAVLSDSLHLDRADTRRALAIFDRPVLRFDWGSARTFASMTGEPQTRLKEVVDHLTDMDRVILHTTFRRGTPDNTTPNEVRGWLKRIQAVRPLEVEVSTVKRKSTRKPGIPKPVSPSFLEDVVETLQAKTGIPTRISAVPV